MAAPRTASKTGRERGSSPLSAHLYLALPAKPGKNRYTRQNYQQSIKGVWPVAAKRIVEKSRCHCDKHSRDERITEHSIWPRSIGIAPSEDENRAAGDHIEE